MGHVHTRYEESENQDPVKGDELIAIMTEGRVAEGLPPKLASVKSTFGIRRGLVGSSRAYEPPQMTTKSKHVQFT